VCFVAANDIRPFASPHGSSELVTAYPIAASQTFREGEPVVFSSGALNEASDDPAAISGIAMAPARLGAGDPRGTAHAAGTPISVYRAVDSALFRCENFATDGAGTAATPTQANAIGVQAGLTLNGSDWYVDTGTTNILIQIEDVRDSNGHSIANPAIVAGAGAEVIFRFL